MVARHLGNDVGRVASADFSVIDGDHVWVSLSKLQEFKKLFILFAIFAQSPPSALEFYLVCERFAKLVAMHSADRLQTPYFRVPNGF